MKSRKKCPKKDYFRVSFDIVCLFEMYRLICTQGYFLHPAGETSTVHCTHSSETMQIYRHMHDDTHPHVFIASLQIYSGLTFFLGKVALEKVSLDANTRKGGHFETLGKRLFIGPLALATFLLTFAQDAFLLHQTHKYKIQIQMQKHTHTYKSKR